MGRETRELLESRGEILGRGNRESETVNTEEEEEESLKIVAL